MRLHQLQQTADQLESAVRGEAKALAEQTHDGLVRGRRSVEGWEKWAGQSMRANPMLYAGAALVIVGLALVLKRPRRANQKDAEPPS